MSGRHEDRPRGHVGLRWFVAAAALLTLLVSFAATGPAGAAAKTVKTQLSLTGLASENNPLGGSVIGIRPGDKVSISTSSLPTRGLDKLGLGGLVDGLLNTVLPVQSTADFSKLPGGAAKTLLKGATAKTFSFPKVGTYTFTWQIEQATLLGAVPIKLDGNQLEKAGVKLNAGNQYVGAVVVSNNPPKGGISVQLPKISVAPSLPVVGQLPTISLPGVTAPTIPVEVPDLNPTKTPAKTDAPTPAASSSSGFDYTPPGLSIPDLVVPQGSGGGGGGAGVAGDALADGSNGLLPDSTSGSGDVVSKRSADSTDSQDLPAYGSGDNKTIDLASENADPTSQVPVILAILAIIALALVAGTYARLFLLKKQV